MSRTGLALETVILGDEDELERVLDVLQEASEGAEPFFADWKDVQAAADAFLGEMADASSFPVPTLDEPAPGEPEALWLKRNLAAVELPEDGCELKVVVVDDGSDGLCLLAMPSDVDLQRILASAGLGARVELAA